MSRKFTLFAKITTHKFSATQCDWITYFGYDKIKDRGISKSEKKKWISNIYEDWERICICFGFGILINFHGC